MPAKKNVADQYQLLGEIEHILKRPEVQIGSCQYQEADMFIADIESSIPKIIKKQMMFSAGFERIYEEILLNAFDQTVREGTGCNEIHVNIDQESGTISVMNNGEGIPVVTKDDIGCYIPEMLFGHLRTSSNYDDTKERITGGQNGYGATLANIMSNEFTVETIDSVRKKHYVQTWTNHMATCSPPIIKKCSRKPMTRVTFKPNLKYFKIESLNDE